MCQECKVRGSTCGYCWNGRIAAAAGLLLTALSLTACPPTRPDPQPTPDPVASASPLLEVPAIVGPMFGMTIDDPSDISAIVHSVITLPQRPFVRVVFDPENGPSHYAPLIAALSLIHVPVLGELVDSFDLPKFDVTSYSNRAAIYSNYFGNSIIYEIGNEVNGDWTGPNVGAKVLAAYWVIHDQGFKTAITGYLCTYNNQPKMTEWLEKNLPVELRSGIDYALVSHYEQDCVDSDQVPAPVPQSIWNSVFNRMGDLFPNAWLGMGETGIGVKNDKELGTTAERVAYLKRYYTMKIDHPRYKVQGFWWFTSDVVPAGQPVWNALAEVMK